MYTVEGQTYYSFEELTKEYNRRQHMYGGVNFTKEFVAEYRKCAEKEKDKAK